MAWCNEKNNIQTKYMSRALTCALFSYTCADNNDGHLKHT